MLTLLGIIIPKKLVGIIIVVTIVVTPAVKMALKNPSRLLTSRSDIIIKRVVPMGCSLNRGLPPVSPRTNPLRHDLQNNQNFKHKW